jgi:hypothetical protein
MSQVKTPKDHINVVRQTLMSEKKMREIVFAKNKEKQVVKVREMDEALKSLFAIEIAMRRVGLIKVPADGEV